MQAAADVLRAVLFSDLAHLTCRHRGTTPNSTAVLPRTTRRQRRTGWSAVDTSETSSLGPMPSSLMCRKASLVVGRKKR